LYLIYVLFFSFFFFAKRWISEQKTPLIVMVREKKWYESWYDMTLSEYMYIMECQHFSNFRNRFIITNLRKNQTFLNLIQQGRIQDFKLGGAHLKKNAPSGGRHENCWGISFEKSRFYAKKITFFPILGGILIFVIFL
jgi:hypothetical protein